NSTSWASTASPSTPSTPPRTGARRASGSSPPTAGT
ncbi:uncharacterized protein METZ01_LOCUS202194, partial [marine metagenome]